MPGVARARRGGAKPMISRDPPFWQKCRHGAGLLPCPACPQICNDGESLVLRGPGGYQTLFSEFFTPWELRVIQPSSDWAEPGVAVRTTQDSMPEPQAAMLMV